MDVRWVGLRVDAAPPFEPLLTDHLAVWMRSKQQQGVLRRWFFLWHGEGGYHLRLRLQPSRGTPSAELVDGLQDLQHASAGRFRLRPHDYDRDTRAFGQTRESIIAELLHEATSALAVDVLTGDPTGVSARRWLSAAAVTAVLMRRAIPREHLDDAVTKWLTFAARSAAELGFDVRSIRQERIKACLGALEAAIPRMETAVDSHDPARRAVALLRRARQRGERGRFVATHALHLFCNEMRLDFGQECAIVMALRALWAPQRSTGRAAHDGSLQ